MIVVDKVVVSSEVEKEFFVCDLIKCKGACCVEGDLGAPLEEGELDLVDGVIEVAKAYLPENALKVLETEGGYVLDEEGDFSTTTIEGRECVFAFRDKQDILKCSIEQAWLEGKTEFRKPISCHLYPVRVAKLDQFEALNFDRWHICTPACDHGAQLGIPLYKFLKEPLIRKYGPDWYGRLEGLIEGNEESSGN